MAAGPNALRGSGPNPNLAFEDALTLAGSPDPRGRPVSALPRRALATSTTISHGLRDNDPRADLLIAGLYGGEVGNCTARFTRRHVLSGSKLVICMPISVVRQPRSFS